VPYASIEKGNQGVRGVMLADDAIVAAVFGRLRMFVAVGGKPGKLGGEIGFFCVAIARHPTLGGQLLEFGWVVRAHASWRKAVCRLMRVGVSCLDPADMVRDRRSRGRDIAMARAPSRGQPHRGDLLMICTGKNSRAVGSSYSGQQMNPHR